jgi:hypothetical protein
MFLLSDIFLLNNLLSMDNSKNLIINSVKHKLAALRFNGKHLIREVVKSTLATIREINLEELEILKAGGPRAGLVKKQITNKAGKRQTVWVKAGEDQPKVKSKSAEEPKPKPKKIKSGPTQKITQKRESTHLEKQASENNFKSLTKLVDSVNLSDENGTQQYMNGLKEIAQNFTPNQIKVIKNYKNYLEKSNTIFSESERKQAEIDSQIEKLYEEKNFKKNKKKIEKLEQQLLEVQKPYDKQSNKLEAYKTKALIKILGTKNVQNQMHLNRSGRKGSHEASLILELADNLASLIKA